MVPASDDATATHRASPAPPWWPLTCPQTIVSSKAMRPCVRFSAIPQPNGSRITSAINARQMTGASMRTGARALRAPMPRPRNAATRTPFWR